MTEVHFILKGLKPDEWDAVFRVMSDNKLDFDDYFTVLIVKACQELVKRREKQAS